MLELKPCCEHCNRPLPPASTEAMICSYECTFCKSCVETVLHNVCPNCGGGFSPRPQRPRHAWRKGVSLEHQPAAAQGVSRPVDVKAHGEFSLPLRSLPPEER